MKHSNVVGVWLEMPFNTTYNEAVATLPPGQGAVLCVPRLTGTSVGAAANRAHAKLPTFAIRTSAILRSVSVLQSGGGATTQTLHPYCGRVAA